MEVIGIVAADLSGDFRYAHFGVYQQVLRFADAAAVYVLHGRKARFGLEDVCHVVLIGVGSFGDDFQIDILFVMFVDEILYFGGEREFLDAPRLTISRSS